MFGLHHLKKTIWDPQHEVEVVGSVLPVRTSMQLKYTSRLLLKLETLCHGWTRYVGFYRSCATVRRCIDCNQSGFNFDERCSPRISARLE
jgi:hypothetical protein